MTVYFCDSSTLVKRYITEKGTGWVRTTLSPSSSNRIVIAQVTPIEVASALARRVRDQTITPRAARAAQLLLERHVSREYTVMQLKAEIVAQAIAFLYQYPLRAYDAVQLASVHILNLPTVQSGRPPLVLLCADGRLLNIATSIGLLTANPENYP